MKKTPSHKFQQQSGMKVIVGTMAEESRERRSNWLKYGCNAFDTQYPSSQPISFWKEQDILKYIIKYNVPYPTVYGEIKQDKNDKYYMTGCDRTGCMFCMFGCHLDSKPNRFQRMKETHPKQYEYMLKPIEEGGLGMKEVLDYIGVEYD